MIAVDNVPTPTAAAAGAESDGTRPAHDTISDGGTAQPIETEIGRSWALTYAVEGDLRFISHHDTLRLFQRALARAELPVRFSQGFNPHASVSVVLPRPVGVASDVEVVVIEFERLLSEHEALSRLSDQMPRGLTLKSARRLARGEKLHPSLARYRLDAHGLLPIDVDQRIRVMLESTSLTIERKQVKTGRTRIIDARSYLEDIHRCGSAVEFALRIRETGTVRPAEMAVLLGMDARAGVARMRRIEIQWRNTSDRTREAHDGTKERNEDNAQKKDRERQEIHEANETDD